MKKFNNSNIITAIIAIIITVALIAAMVLALIRSNQTEKPNPEPESSENAETTNAPFIPDISENPDYTEVKNPKDNNYGTEDIQIDVEQPLDESRNDNPRIDDDVAIIPGVKGENE